jgi:hypothetical protein
MYILYIHQHVLVEPILYYKCTVLVTSDIREFRRRNQSNNRTRTCIRSNRKAPRQSQICMLLSLLLHGSDQSSDIQALVISKSTACIPNNQSVTKKMN